MSNQITLNEPDVDTLILTWTGLELWHSSTQGGTYTLLTTIPYVGGQTVYPYTDAAGLITDWYTVRRYAPGAVYSSYSAPWTDSIVPPTRRSLQNIRRILARALHSLTVVTTTADSAATVAGSSIVALQLANSVNANRYKHAWVMPSSGTCIGQIRRVRVEDALNLNTGELLVAPAFTSQITALVEVEVHRLLPPDDDDGWVGLRSCINDALRECWTTDRLPVVGVDGAPSYSLAAYEEWLDPEAVLEFRGAAVDSTLNSFAAGQFRSVHDADALSIQVSPTLSTGSANAVEVFRPADTWVKSGGVWGASTTGLLYEGDEALLQPDLVAQVALAHAYEALASGPDGGRYEDKARKQRLKANILKNMHLDHTQRAPRSGLTTAGYYGVDKSNPLGLGSW